MAVELMDNNIIEAAYRNPAQRNNTFFIKDKPQAILIIEFAFDSEESLDACLNETIEDFKSEDTAYDFSIVKGEDISKVWGVRKAGLGLLTNIPGSKKPVSVIEDTAVNPQKLPSYLEEFQTILDKYKLKCVYHVYTKRLQFVLHIMERCY
jgi:FAD/FMN-containing dehydrogenase